ncbi:Ectonucleoside triphosphate diphosphohydrolase 1 [Trichinella papuae]|uniref:Ectonucleoside triphosphate diphosphohydrolase 1 n=1 Tax=Trichinella papuae TaxID=268474 RepID=A0A0V1MV89_9BILA|nr:Ectonucleoside triphosphate diphosphohydrolase 1 [Trichinella papuae]
MDEGRKNISARKAMLLKEYQVLLQRSVKSIRENFTEIIKMAKIGDDGQVSRLTEYEHELFEMQIRAANMTHAAEALIKMVTDLKQFLILNDFAYINESITTSAVHNQIAQREFRDKLIAVKEEMTYCLQEAEQEYYNTALKNSVSVLDLFEIEFLRIKMTLDEFGTELYVDPWQTFVSIKGKLRKRAFRSPNLAEVVKDYEALANRLLDENCTEYSALCRMNMAKCKNQLGNIDQEAVEYRTAGRLYIRAEKEKESVENRLSMECLYMAMHCYNEAIRLHLSQGQKLLAASLLIELGKELACMQHPEDAIQNFEKAVHLLDTHPHAVGHALRWKLCVETSVGFLADARRTSNFYRQIVESWPNSGSRKLHLNELEIITVMLLLALKPIKSEMNDFEKRLLQRYSDETDEALFTNDGSLLPNDSYIISVEIYLQLKSFVLAINNNDPSAADIALTAMHHHNVKLVHSTGSDASVPLRVLIKSLFYNESSVSLEVDSDFKVKDVINAYAYRTGRNEKDEEFVLRFHDHSSLNSEDVLHVLGVYNDEELIISVRGEDSRRSRNSWWWLGSVALLISLVGLIAVSVLFALSGDLPDEFGIIIDAGSSHSGLYIYTWNGRKNKTGVIKQYAPSCSTEMGISSFTDNPADAGNSLMFCLNNASATIPSKRHSATAMYLAATAGMRILELRDPLSSCKILSAVSNTMHSYNFLFKNASIISGIDEGIYGWITSNFLSHRLMNSASRLNDIRPLTIGAMDLGGASTQIIFEINSSEFTERNYSLRLFGETYNLFVDSYLCCGLNEVQRIIQAQIVAEDMTNQRPLHPCMPLNYTMNVTSEQIFSMPCSLNQKPNNVLPNYVFRGSSDPHSCLMKIRHMLDTSACSVKKAKIPKPRGEFMAFSGLYWAAKFFNCTSGCSYNKFFENVQNYCEKSWSYIEAAAYPYKKTFLPTYCFIGLYSLTLIKDAYHFSDAQIQDIKFVNEIDSTEIGWTLGFMLNATNQLPEEQPIEHIGLIEFSLITTICCIIRLEQLE